MNNTCPIEFQYPYRNGRSCCSEPVYYEDTICLTEYEECEVRLVDVFGDLYRESYNCRIDWEEEYYQPYDGIIPTPIIETPPPIIETPTPTNTFNPLRIETAYVPTPTPTTDFLENIDKDTLIAGLVSTLGLLLLLIFITLLFGGPKKIKQKVEQAKQ